MAATMGRRKRMLVINAAILISLILLYRSQRSAQEARDLQLRFRLYGVRDKLRDRAACGNIDPRSWAFEYLDGTISKTISFLDYHTLYGLILLPSGESKSAARIREELEKANNDDVQGIINEFSYILVTGLERKYWIFSTLRRIPALVSWLRGKLDAVLVSPQTSYQSARIR
jgi:hypothetical protein